MAKTYDEPITKATDWGGDASTGYLEVKGSRVQEFIKNELKAKGGYFRIKDQKYLEVFNSLDDCLAYDADSSRTDLLLAHVQLPNTGATIATMRVNVLQSPTEYTTSGTAQTFSFLYKSYYDEESDPSMVSGSAVVNVNGKQVAKLALRHGNTYSVSLEKYFTSESNEVLITITNNEGSTRSYSYNVQLVELSVTTTYDEAQINSEAFEFRYTPYGNIMKTIHILLDGEEVYSEDTNVSNRQQTYTFEQLAHGAHLIEVYATADLSGVSVESKHIRVSAVCIESGNTNPIIASTYEGGNVTQYESVTIPFFVYDPTNNPTSVTLKVDDTEVATRSVSREMQSWIYKANTQGTLNLSIVCATASKNFALEVGKSEVTSEAETANLELFLTSQGRSNEDTNRDEWTNNGIAATFSGLNYKTNGWVVDDDGNTALRLLGGATCEIPLNIFGKDIRTTGKTIELEFSAHEVCDYEAVVLSCLSGGIGITLTPNVIKLKSEQSEVSMNYKEDERVRVVFVVQKRNGNRLLQIYVNGIKSQSAQYPENDGFMQSSPVGITMGSDKATLDIYNIRVYSNDLSSKQLLDNYIADMDDVAKKMEVFKRNQVFDSYGNINMSKINQQIPVMVLTGELSQYKGDKKTISVQYTDLNNPSKSFTAEGVQLNVQGTSSQYYPRKNYKLGFKKGLTMTATGEEVTTFTLNEDSVLPAKNFCVKADFAESSGTLNTGMANYVDWMLKQMSYLTAPQKEDSHVRTTVYGEPIVIFHRATETDEPTFIGKYNFNTDKSAENTFGFTEGCQSWEFLNNTSDRCNFNSADFDGDGWTDDLEARYPEDSVDVAEMSKVFAWVVSCKGDTAKFKSEVSNYFDKDILIFYALITLTFGMVDQRAKNMMLTKFTEGGWMFIFYDNDTCVGINNEGKIAFSFNIETQDVIGTLNVWNGANSVLWTLVETAFADELASMYSTLRQKGILSYDKAMEYLNDRQAAKWCEAVYNEDGYFKYESPLIDGYEDWSSGSAQTIKTGSFLYALQGSRDAQRRWWLYNRFKYLDSKFQAGAALSDYITFRTYTPTDYAGVTPNADITLTTLKPMYGTIKWGSVLRSQRLGEGETYKMAAPSMQFNDTETIIYNASSLSSVGDLSALYIGTLDASKGTNLTELIIGSSVSGYHNDNFSVLSLGNNPSLRKLDIRNCPNYKDNVDASGCASLDEVYAEGSSATAVNLADGCAIKVLHLPTTTTNITLKNLPNLTTSNLVMAGTDNVVQFVAENCPNLDAYSILTTLLSKEDNKVARIRLVGIDASATDLSTLLNMTNLNGVDESGNVVTSPIITGKLHVTIATEEALVEVKKNFPDLVVTYDKYYGIPTRTLKFVDTDNSNAAIVGASVTINGTEYTTDSNGEVSVRTSLALSVKFAAAGYQAVEKNFSSSNYDTSATISTYKVYSAILFVQTHYYYPIQNTTIYMFNANDKTDEYYYQTDNNGCCNVVCRNVSYYVQILVGDKYVSYGQIKFTEEQTAIAVINTANTLPCSTFRKSYNGNIRMLVYTQQNTLKLKVATKDSAVYSIPISVEGGMELSFNSDEVAEIDASSIFANTNYKGKAFHIEIGNCGNITWLSLNATGYIVALWSIGDSAIDDSLFSNKTIDGYAYTYSISASYLYNIGADMFDNCTTKTSFSRQFYSYGKLEELPNGLFSKCAKLTDLYCTFGNCGPLKVPADIFDGLGIKTMYETFMNNSAMKVLHLPSSVTQFGQTSTQFEALVCYPTTPPTLGVLVMKADVGVIYVPDESVDTYKTATNWSKFADVIKPMSEKPEDI